MGNTWAFGSKVFTSVMFHLVFWEGCNSVGAAIVQGVSGGIVNILGRGSMEYFRVNKFI
jgi:hypothetical protein